LGLVFSETGQDVQSGLRPETRWTWFSGVSVGTAGSLSGYMPPGLPIDAQVSDAAMLVAGYRTAQTALPALTRSGDATDAAQRESGTQVELPRK